MSNPATIQALFKSLHQDAALWKAQRLWNDANDPDQQAVAMDAIVTMLCCIKNETKRQGYIDLIQKQNKIKSGLLKKQVKEVLDKRDQKKQDEIARKKFEASYQNAEDAGLVEGFNGNIFDALKYGIYEHNGIMYTRGKGADIPVSNFTMKIVYHSQTGADKAYRLISIKNVYGFEKMILIDTDDFVSMGSFKKIIARYGDYIFKGGDSDLSRLQEMLQKDEINSVYVGQMGWNNRYSFYAFANGIIPYSEESESFLPVDRYGIVENNERYFFIPAMSEMFIDKDEKFEAEKKFVYRPPREDFKFKEWSSLFYQVYADKAKVAIPFYVAALYRDIIFKQSRRFPLLNLYGPPGAGKGELAESLMYMFGEKQDPVPLEAGSTKVGMQRKIGFASNGLTWLDEYKNSLNKDMIGGLKSLYDGQGRVTGKMTNDMQTNVTSVKSAVILSGQDMPTIDPALYTRVIMLAFEEGKYSDEQRAKFSVLKEKEQDGGFSYITASLLRYRPLVDEKFKDAFAVISKQTFKEVANVEIEDRMIRNISMLLTIIHILQEHVQFPFTYVQAKAFLISNMEYQHAILVGNTDVSKFWNIVEMLVHQLVIHEGREFMLKDKCIYIKLQLVFPLYLKEMRLRGDANYLGSVDSLRHYLSLNKQSYVEHKKVRFTDGSNVMCDILKYDGLGVDLIRIDNSSIMTDAQKNLAFKTKYDEMGIGETEPAPVIAAVKTNGFHPEETISNGASMNFDDELPFPPYTKN